MFGVNYIVCADSVGAVRQPYQLVAILCQYREQFTIQGPRREPRRSQARPANCSARPVNTPSSQTFYYHHRLIRLQDRISFSSWKNRAETGPIYKYQSTETYWDSRYRKKSKTKEQMAKSIDGYINL